MKNERKLWDFFNSAIIVLVISILFHYVIVPFCKNHEVKSNVRIEIRSIDQEIRQKLITLGEILAERDKKEDGTLEYNYGIGKIRELSIHNHISKLIELKNGRETDVLEKARDGIISLIANLSSRHTKLIITENDSFSFTSNIPYLFDPISSSYVGYVTINPETGETKSGNIEDIIPKFIWRTHDRDACVRYLYLLNLDRWDKPLGDVITYMNLSKNNQD